jgi:hypothetical protein
MGCGACGGSKKGKSSAIQPESAYGAPDAEQDLRYQIGTKLLGQTAAGKPSGGRVNLRSGVSQM